MEHRRRRRRDSVCASNTGLVTDEARQLRELVKGGDSIELKLTLPDDSYRSAAAALDVDPLDAQVRVGRRRTERVKSHPMSGEHRRSPRRLAIHTI